jgi:hypothetical protein
VTLAERSPADARSDASPRPRLDLKDALSICFAMLDEDPSLYRAATEMWHALAPFVPALIHAQAELALEALDALDRPDAPSRLRALHRRASRPELVDLPCVIDQWRADSQGRPNT